MTPNTPPAQLTFREVLAILPVRKLWIAQIVSIFGDFLAIFAVFSVVTFEFHGTPNQVSMILVSFLAPLAIISPLAGVFVDRWNVKIVMIASDIIRGFLVLGLLYAHNLNVIYAIFFAMSAVSSFFMPAQSVTVRTITPTAGLMTTNALMSQAIQGLQIISPAIAGLLVQWLGAKACFLIDSVSFFVSAGLVFTIAIHRAPAAVGQRASSVLASMRQGVTFIFTHAAISFVVISMTAGMFAVRCFGALLSVYVRDVLAAGSSMFGILNSLIGVGMIAATQFIPRLTKKVSKQHLVTYGLGGMGLAVLVAAAFTTVPSTAVAMLGLGFFAAFVMIPAQTLVQTETPQELLGRVSSSLMSLLTMSQVIAMFVAGPVAQSAGIRSLYYGSAALLAVIAVIGHWQLRQPSPALDKAAGA
jgi:DHA3 family macrolide efflux protein-like MFS transporter